MKTYLSSGMGINSVAMQLLMLDEGWDFEAVFVDHGCDWPETYEYLEMFQGWLKDNGHRQITVIRPELFRNKVRGKEIKKTYNNLYEYAWDAHLVPVRVMRWCTQHFKVDPLRKYLKTPCFNCLGFAMEEAHRAHMKCRDGEELRYPLLEYELSRDDCIAYIKKHGLPVPVKSGCWFCPFMRIQDFKRLRIEHPDLYCKAKALEDRSVARQIESGRERINYLKDPNKPLDVIVNEAQGELFEEYKPPCYCAR